MTEPKNYCYICGEKVEVGHRFEHCRTVHGLFPGVSSKEKHNLKFRIICKNGGIFGTREELADNIKKLVDKHMKLEFVFR